MSNIEKVLTKLRRLAQYGKCDCPDGNTIHSCKVLDAFTAEMPGAIGECVEYTNDCRAAGYSPPDHVLNALAKLEGK